MSVLIEHSPNEISKLIREHQERPIPEEGQHICTETIRRYSNQWKAEAGLEQGPVFLSGHQPIFMHPGILAKDMLLQALVRKHGGVALALILDTDQESIDFAYPARGAHRRSIVLSDISRIVAGQHLSDVRRQQFLHAIEQSLMDLSSVLSPPAADRARPYLLHLRETALHTDDLVTISNSVREYHARTSGWKMQYLRASDLIRTQAFRFFAGEVCARSSEFRTIFNTALAEYRLMHEIKNHAQPFPDLKEGELPFWFSQDGMRRPLTDADIERSGLLSEGIEAFSYRSLFDEGHILPRAITLSLFLRLFICDLFVHGTGGGRYDRITGKVIERFFRCHAAPITVATATLKLDARADFALLGRSREELDHEERILHFDPVRFLPERCALSEERRMLIELQHHLRGQRKHRAIENRFSPSFKDDALRPAFRRRLPALLSRLYDPQSNPPALLHREFIGLRRKATSYLTKRREELTYERQREERCRENHRLFGDRSLPFFFYDLSEIEQRMNEYAKSTD